MVKKNIFGVYLFFLCFVIVFRSYVDEELYDTYHLISRLWVIISFGLFSFVVFTKKIPILFYFIFLFFIVVFSGHILARQQILSINLQYLFYANYSFVISIVLIYISDCMGKKWVWYCLGFGMLFCLMPFFINNVSDIAGNFDVSFLFDKTSRVRRVKFDFRNANIMPLLVFSIPICFMNAESYLQKKREKINLSCWSSVFFFLFIGVILQARAAVLTGIFLVGALVMEKIKFKNMKTIFFTTMFFLPYILFLAIAFVALQPQLMFYDYIDYFFSRRFSMAWTPGFELLLKTPSNFLWGIWSSSHPEKEVFWWHSMFFEIIGIYGIIVFILFNFANLLLGLQLIKQKSWKKITILIAILVYGSFETISILHINIMTFVFWNIFFTNNFKYISRNPPRFEDY